MELLRSSMQLWEETSAFPFQSIKSEVYLHAWVVYTIIKVVENWSCWWLCECQMLKSQSYSAWLVWLCSHVWSADHGLPALVREDTQRKGCELRQTSSALREVVVHSWGCPFQLVRLQFLDWRKTVWLPFLCTRKHGQYCSRWYIFSWVFHVKQTAVSQWRLHCYA